MTTLMMDRAPMTRPMLSWRTSHAALRRWRRQRRLEAFWATLQPETRRHLPKIWLGRGAEQQFVPDVRRVVVAVDPPASAGRGADACGIVAAATDAGGLGYVI